MSLIRAKEILSSLPEEWRLIPGHKYDTVGDRIPDWISIGEVLTYNYFLANITINKVNFSTVFVILSFFIESF